MSTVAARQRQRERYATDKQHRDKVCGRARMENLRLRGGLCEDTKDFVPVLLCDPCAVCGELMPQPGRIAPKAAALDHIDPDGSSHWTNLAGMCSSCNASKGRMTLLLALLERQLRRDLTPIAEQLWVIKGRSGSRRRIEF